MDFTWVDSVITAVQKILVLLGSPPLSYFLGLILLAGVIQVITTIIKPK